MSEQKEEKDLTAFQDYLLNGEIDRAKRLLNTKCQELTNVIRGRPAIPDYKDLPRDDLATALIYLGRCHSNGDGRLLEIFQDCCIIS